MCMCVVSVCVKLCAHAHVCIITMVTNMMTCGTDDSTLFLLQEHLQGRGFTFWDWFYKTCELIKTCLRREWNAK